MFRYIFLFRLLWLGYMILSTTSMADRKYVFEILKQCFGYLYTTELRFDMTFCFLEMYVNTAVNPC